jgi:hypothetical protein
MDQLVTLEREVSEVRRGIHRVTDQLESELSARLRTTPQSP